MAGTKRTALTADDLLRRQEEPRRKRARLSPDSDLDSASADSGTEQDEESARSGSEDDDESDEDDENNMPGNEPDTAPVQDRFGPSLAHRKPSTTALAPPPPTSFSSLGISAPLQSALSSMSIRTPTPVQAACIPALLAGRDCIGNAQTGSGKTIAFALPILQQLSLDPYGIFALVLTPTRELAFQIADQFAVLGGALAVRTAVIVGGMDMMAQALALGARPHVVIATPGRLVDHLRSGAGEWDLARVRFLVLDEADRLLTQTFSAELAHLFGALPQDRQTCLFTATLTPAIEALAEATPRAGKQKPFVHRASETVETVSTLKQHYILMPSYVREAYLYHLLCHPPESTLHLRRAPPEPVKGNGKGKEAKWGKEKGKRKKVAEEDEEPEQPPPTIIFCTRPKTAAYLTALLQGLGIRSTALHSRLTQRERLASLGLFRACVVPVLVSTDVGARGLDIEEVAMVINWDMPNEAEEYTHRVGRTARAGRGGVAVSFVTERDEERVARIEERIKTKLLEMDLAEGAVLEKLNKVSTAKRVANMELHDSDFGKREEIHRVKERRARGV